MNLATNVVSILVLWIIMIPCEVLTTAQKNLIKTIVN
jgi:hypothetical protein